MSSNWYQFIERNMGNRITPELAQGLYNSFLGVVNDVYKTAFNDAVAAANKQEALQLNIAPGGALDGYEFRLGSYEGELQAFEPLQKMHLAEVETARDPRLTFQADQEGMIQMERRGVMRIFLILKDTVPVGYMTMQFHRDQGTGLMIGSEFHFFVHPDHRKGWLALQFIRWLEKGLKASGISEMRVGVRDVKDVSILYRRLGYKGFAHLYSKVL